MCVCVCVCVCMCALHDVGEIPRALNGGLPSHLELVYVCMYVCEFFMILEKSDALARACNAYLRTYVHTRKRKLLRARSISGSMCVWPMC